MLSYCHCRKKSIRSKKTANSNNDNALVCGFDVCSGDQNLRITGHCTTFQTYFKFLWFSYFDSNSLNESRKMQQNGSMIKSQNYYNSLGQTTLYTRLTTAKVLLSARLTGSTVWIACLIRHHSTTSYCSYYVCLTGIRHILQNLANNIAEVIVSYFTESVPVGNQKT